MGTGWQLSAKITMYSTCPQSKDVARADYAAHVAEVARWSDEAGCRGMLVYTDNSIADPWMVAQHVIANTTSLRPLVAVQPVYMHPYTAAKIVSSIAFLHGRAVDLNLVAGGFRNDLRALGDETPHDERYDRVVEYATIVQQLLDERGAGHVRGPLLPGHEPPAQAGRCRPSSGPACSISGSSPAGRDAARAIDAIGVRYPQPPDEEDELDLANGLRHGIRVGIIAREDAAEAWAVARARFPANRQGEITHALAMKVTDSEWHKQLAATADGGEDALDPVLARAVQELRHVLPVPRRQLRARRRGGRPLPRARGADDHHGHPARAGRSAPRAAGRPRRPGRARRVTALLHERVSAVGARARRRDGARLAGRRAHATASSSRSRTASRTRWSSRAAGPATGSRSSSRRSPRRSPRCSGRSRPAAPTSRSTSRARPRAPRGSSRRPTSALVVVHSVGAGAPRRHRGRGRRRAPELVVATTGRRARRGRRRSGRRSTPGRSRRCPTRRRQSPSARTTPAHILFTSGSTGLPKGVLITHDNVAAFLDWALPDVRDRAPTTGSRRTRRSTSTSRPSTSTARSAPAPSCSSSTRRSTSARTASRASSTRPS